MSNTDGLLINNNNIYGLVNPPPVPDPKDKPKIHQDPSSAAVRWDYFVDLSNNGFSFVPSSTQFSSIIDEVPWQQGANSTPSSAIWFPAYQQTQVVFTQDKTFSKIRLWLKGRKGLLSTVGTGSLQDLLPSDIYFGQSSGSNIAANWADPSIPPGLVPYLGTINQDGLINAIFNNNPDTGILEGQGVNSSGYNAWDISGPTKLADPGDGSTYSLYENIKPNGWNLGWKVVITETAPDGTMKYLKKNGLWSNATTDTGFILCYNPKAWSFINSNLWTQSTVLDNPSSGLLQGFFSVPKLTKNSINSAISTLHTTLKDIPWGYSSGALNASQETWDDYGSFIHSQNSKFYGSGSGSGNSNLWYVEKEFGEQFNIDPNSPSPPPGSSPHLSAWTPRPVIFKKDHGYLANVTMVNLWNEFNRKNPGQTGPGLGKVDALTYLELIV